MGSLLTIIGCKDDAEIIDLSEIFTGDEIAFADGIVKVWYAQDEAGNPSEIGITLSSAALVNLPLEDPMNPFANWHTLNFPDETTNSTPFRYMLFSWNEHGHPPMDIYTAPHFDFHFYIQPNEERLRIPAYEVDPTLFLVDPDATYIPNDYEKEFGGVPLMGAHWVDLTSGEWNNEDFNYTFIYGSYDGEITFYEPMITLEVLQNLPDLGITQNIKQPVSYPITGMYYPNQYSIKKDTISGEITISMGDFILR